MALPPSTETPRTLHLRNIVEKLEDNPFAWPMPTDEDFAVFGTIIHVYSAIDFLMRYLAECMDARGMLSKSWEGMIAAKTIFVVSKEVQANQMWNESHRIAFERIEYFRRFRNMAAHFVIRRFPDEDAFLFMTKSAADFQRVIGDVPATDKMLFGVIDAEQIKGAIPELKNLNQWLAKVVSEVAS
jgi:hypothetical protein